MATFGVPSILWITLLITFVTLSLSIIIGRWICNTFPFHLRASARFYLSPVLGLAFLTIFASYTCKLVPIGQSKIPFFLIILLIAGTLIFERQKIKLLQYILVLYSFGIICGLSLLVPLFAYGAFNAHCDAFTYLVHSNWLQNNSFNNIIHPEMVTPLNGQVFWYQVGSYRMGASFLLALIQSMFRIQWSYEVYPAIVISAITSCCLAIGFPLLQIIRSMPRYLRLTILSFPAFSLGGLVFGANLGFFPQTIGLAFSSALLFVLGQLLFFTSRLNTLAEISRVKKRVC